MAVGIHHTGPLTGCDRGGTNSSPGEAAVGEVSVKQEPLLLCNQVAAGPPEGMIVDADVITE